MNSIKSYTVALLAAATIFTSCDDYLSNVPKGQKIPTSLEDFRTLMADDYSNLREPVTNALYLLGDQYASNATLSYDRLACANYTLDTSINRVKENSSDESLYYTAYRSINTACLVLENAPEATDATDTERRQVMAQARVLRALAYYRLVNYYSKTYNSSTASTDGGVPLITSAEVGAAYTQPSVQAIYDFILEDINAALTDLPETSENILYANKATGYAAAARVYLQMGNYDQALAMARQAMNANGELFDWTAFYAENEAVLSAEGTYQRISSPLGYDFAEYFNFIHGSSSYSGGEMSIPQERGEQFGAADAMFLSRWKLRSVAGETYYYGMLSGNFGRGSLSTTEMLFIMAECYAQTNNIEQAMQLVNQSRSMRILADQYQPASASSRAEAMDIIMRDKSNALITTFVPFCDRRRWNLDSTTARTLTRTIDGEVRSLTPDSYFWTMPFPQGAVTNSGNGTITQNVDK